MPEITLSEFTNTVRQEIENFAVWWYSQYLNNPDSYPTLMPDPEWFEQFLTFVETNKEENEL
jgi:hypothetical protein